MNKFFVIITAAFALALSASFAEAGNKTAIGGGATFDGTLTGTFSGAIKGGKAHVSVSNSNAAMSKTTAKNGSIKSRQATGSASASSSSAHGNGFAAGASGGFGAAVGGGVSARHNR